jgi:tetratricopeptide (TPR) repeat protein
MTWQDDIDVRLLPFPVAFALRRLMRARRAGGAVDELEHLLDLVEETMRYVNARLMADHLLGDVPFTDQAVRLIGKKQSFGDRTQLAMHLAGGLDSKLARHLSQTWAKRHGGLGPALEHIVEHRNAVRHGARPTEAAAQEHLDALTPVLERIVPLFIELQGEKLFSIYRPPREGENRPTVMPWNGPHPAEDEVTLDLDLPAYCAGTCFAIFGEEAMFLGPLFAARDEPLADDQDLWVYDHGVPDQTSGAGSARWANNRVQKVDVPSSAELLEGTLRDLAKALMGSARPDQTKAQVSLASYYFATTPALISRLMSTYVQRPEVDLWVDELLAARSGALWIEARAGIGKSSVMARLCEKYGAINHFVTASEGRSNVPAILRSIIAQIIDRNGIQTSPTENDEALAQQLGNLLVAVAMSSSEPTVIAIDALDELGSSSAVDRFLSAFPNPLPDNTCLVVSARPMPPTWRASHKFTIEHLGPLSIDAVQALAFQHEIATSPEVCEKAFAASQGNPLFFLWALRVLAVTPERDVDFTHNLEDYFGSVLGIASNNEDSEPIQRILSILVAAGTPIDLPTLIAATSNTRLDILRSLDAIKDLVVVSDGKLSLTHKLISDYLSDSANFMALAQESIRAAHRALASIALAPTTSYPAGMAAYHLLASDALDDLVTSIDAPGVAGAVPQALLKIADEHPDQALFLFRSLASRGGEALRPVLRSSLVALVEAGRSGLVGEFLASPDSGVLTARDRGIVELWQAAAQDNYDQILATSDRLLGEIGDIEEEGTWAGECLFLRGQAFRIHGRHAEALDAYERSDALLPASAPILKFRALFQIADLDYVYGRLTRARTNLEKLNNQMVQQGMSGLRVRVLREIGHIDLAVGDCESAARNYTEALDVAIVSRQADRIAECYVSLAEALAALDPKKSVELARLGRHWADQAQARIEHGKSFYVEAEALLRGGDVDGALAAAGRSLVELTEVGYGSGCARARAVVGECMLRADPTEAVPVARAVIEYYARERIYPMLRMAGLDLGRRVGVAVGAPGLFDEIDTGASVPYLEEFPQFC